MFKKQFKETLQTIEPIIYTDIIALIYDTDELFIDAKLNLLNGDITILYGEDGVLIDPEEWQIDMIHKILEKSHKEFKDSEDEFVPDGFIPFYPLF